VLEFTGLGVRIGGREIISGLSHVVPTGRVHAVTGPSGSGKSTLLRALCGLVPCSGVIRVDGTDVTAVPVHRRGIGMMFQDDQLFPSMDVAGNVAYGMRMIRGARRPGRRERTQRVGELLSMVGLAGFGDRDPATLSGGEKRRVALARALAPSPAVLLLDEPLTGLDPELHDRLLADLAGLLAENDTTCLVVTHDRREADALADTVVSMDELALNR
jgi:thiamine transport system ATP-binding protein